MRRRQWVVFTSMNPRQSAWRALYEPAPAADERQDDEDATVQHDPASSQPEPALPDRRLRV